MRAMTRNGPLVDTQNSATNRMTWPARRLRSVALQPPDQLLQPAQTAGVAAAELHPEPLAGGPGHPPLDVERRGRARRGQRQDQRGPFRLRLRRLDERPARADVRQ